MSKQPIEVGQVWKHTGSGNEYKVLFVYDQYVMAKGPAHKPRVWSFPDLRLYCKLLASKEDLEKEALDLRIRLSSPFNETFNPARRELIELIKFYHERKYNDGKVSD